MYSFATFTRDYFNLLRIVVRCIGPAIGSRHLITLAEFQRLVTDGLLCD